MSNKPLLDALRDFRDICPDHRQLTEEDMLNPKAPWASKARIFWAASNSLVQQEFRYQLDRQPRLVALDEGNVAKAMETAIAAALRLFPLNSEKTETDVEKYLKTSVKKAVLHQSRFVTGTRQVTSERRSKHHLFRKRQTANSQIHLTNAQALSSNPAIAIEVEETLNEFHGILPTLPS